MNRIWLVHGFNVRDGGQSTILKIGPFVEDQEMHWKKFDYGWMFLLGVAIGSRLLARVMSGIVEHGDLAIGHSNGCALLHRAAWRGAPFRAMAYINPVLDRDIELAPQIEHCDVWHSPSDAPVKWARFIPFSPWGDMGAKGYTGTDKRYRNFNKQADFTLSSKTHSDVFREGMMHCFAPRIIKRLAETVISS